MTAASATLTVPPEQDQECSGLHSGNSGFIVHRLGQSKPGLHRQALEFAWALMGYTNGAVGEYVTTRTYEEIFGARGAMHWLIHMKAPNDYGRILKMVDHDRSFRQVADADRLPAQGGGGWDRVFVESCFKETIMVPQHGLDHLTEREGLNPDYDESQGYFVSPAQHQTATPAGQLLHSGNAGAILHRKGQLKYQFRNEGRAFAFEWQDHFNGNMQGNVTSFLYEEGWGSQDRIHLLIHLKNLDQYKEILRREQQDPACRAILSKERVSTSEGGGNWEQLFVAGTLTDTVMVPSNPASGL